MTAGNGVTYFVSNYITVELTNNFRYGFTNSFTFTAAVHCQKSSRLPFRADVWSGNPDFKNNPSGFVTFISSNFVTLPSCYFSESSNGFVFFTNGVMSDNQFLRADTNQTSWSVHNWILSITNHVVYAVFDGKPGQAGSALLDYVNLGPFGFSTNLTQMAALQGDGNNGGGGLGGLAGSSWNFSGTSDNPGPMYPGLINQVNNGITSDSIYNWNCIGYVSRRCLRVDF